jgi:hypothetical protein
LLLVLIFMTHSEEEQGWKKLENMHWGQYVDTNRGVQFQQSYKMNLGYNFISN